MSGEAIPKNGFKIPRMNWKFHENTPPMPSAREEGGYWRVFFQEICQVWVPIRGGSKKTIQTEMSGLKIYIRGVMFDEIGPYGLYRVLRTKIGIFTQNLPLLTAPMRPVGAIKQLTEETCPRVEVQKFWCNFHKRFRRYGPINKKNAEFWAFFELFFFCILSPFLIGSLSRGCQKTQCRWSDVRRSHS